jgi:hypothetical protein
VQQAAVAAHQAADAKQKLKNEADDLIQQGIDAYNRQDYEAAIQSFQGALEITPDDSTITDWIQKAKDAIAAKKKREQAAFDKNKNEGLSQLRGLAQGGNFDSNTGLKTIGSTDSGLKGMGDNSSGLKTLSNENNDAQVVDLRGAGTTVVDPARVNGTSPSLKTINPSDEDKALMRHQWEMSIDARYLSDPAVQQHLRDLWVAARSDDDATFQNADNKLKEILADQFKADGETPQQIADFFTKFMAIATGEGKTPKEWITVSPLANAMDGVGSLPRPAWSTTPSYYSQLVTNIGSNESIKAPDISYMASGKQTEDDCVLYAIANGSQVPEEKVKNEFTTTVNNLAMDPIAERSNPEIIVTSPQKGGRGGVDPIEELLVSEKFGKVIPVPTDSFAKAIASTGRPIITTVNLNPAVPNGGQHKVVVTGVSRAKDGKIYYSVMDSNLGSDYAKSTGYVEKSAFEEHLASGGFVVMPNDKN